MLRSGLAEGGLPSPDAKSRFAEDRMLAATIWCELRPGEIVTEADIMERFGLSRAAARSGLTRLGFDGWATSKARMGWEILPVTGQLIGDVLEARRIVEPGLAHVLLSESTRAEIAQIETILTALMRGGDQTAFGSIRHHVDRIDGLLLGAMNPLTARHLRKLWHHSARITHYLEGGSGTLFRRDDVFDLIHAVLAGDRAGIESARLALIAAQERYFLHQLLKNDAPLLPGSGMATRDPQEDAAPNRRPS
ncbi:GntR family transcriptional regulator [Epibacterium ulvae]|uniref:GntR family transcriptional regulator n=1 Tax=Epibacterium ulvae TaxID=1156985 RepID=UPI0024903741|nr:GntR family transcriptional regulator [Epibacterium ulvae]